MVVMSMCIVSVLVIMMGGALWDRRQRRRGQNKAAA
jgi:hypothetical protein